MTERRPRRTLRLTLALAGLFGLLELPFAAFMADDLIQLGILERVSPNTWTGPLGLYTLSDGDPAHVQAMKDAGAFPWYFDPSFKLALFRPLSSGLLALDHALFGLHPVGYRAHGALWFVVLVGSVGILLRRVLPGPVGELALVLFCISGIHGVLCWTATRHLVIAATLGVAGLLGHVRWREEGWRPGLALALGGFALALTASEAAVAMMGYVAAYELAGAGGSRSRRAKGILPLTAVLAAYLAMYVTLGLGSAGSSAYLDPTRMPMAYLAGLLGRLVFLLGALVLGGNADVWMLRPGARPMLIAGAAVVLVIAGALLATAWRTTSDAEWRSVRWLLLGGGLSALPFAAAPIGSRCLVVPLLGGSAAIALVIHCWWTVLRRTPGPRYRTAGAACALLALIHVVLAPVSRLSAPAILRHMLSERVAAAMAPLGPGEGMAPGKTAIVLAAPDIAVGFHSYFYRRLNRMPMPDRWHVLTRAPGDFRFERTAGDTLVMQILAGSMKAPPGMVAGRVVEAGGMTATILEASGAGLTRVEFRFDRQLDDPDMVLLAWKGARLRRVSAPPVGQAL